MLPREEKSCRTEAKSGAGTGLYYYGARYYDPAISLWLSVDPLAEEYPGVSPYAYTFQNPVKYIDPTGMEGENWYRDKTGNYVYDSNVNADSKLCDGCTYLGETYTIGINGQEDVQLNADGSSTQGDTTSFGMEVDYGWSSGNKVYTGTGGNENSGNAYLNAMNNTTGSPNDFGDFSLIDKGINKALGMGSSLLEGFQVLGFIGYGTGVYIKELATTGKVPTGHRDVTFTKWGIYNGKWGSKSFSEPLDDQSAFNEFVTPAVSALLLGVPVKAINTGSAPLNKAGNMYLKSKIKEGVFNVTRPD